MHCNGSRFDRVYSADCLLYSRLLQYSVMITIMIYNSLSYQTQFFSILIVLTTSSSLHTYRNTKLKFQWNIVDTEWLSEIYICVYIYSVITKIFYHHTNFVFMKVKFWNFSLCSQFIKKVKLLVNLLNFSFWGSLLKASHIVAHIQI